MSDTRSNEEIARDVANIDTGFCNPGKIKYAAEAREEAIDTFMDRGYSREEAEQMLSEAEY